MGQTGFTLGFEGSGNYWLAISISWNDGWKEFSHFDGVHYFLLFGYFPLKHK